MILPGTLVDLVPIILGTAVKLLGKYCFVSFDASFCFMRYYIGICRYVSMYP